MVVSPDVEVCTVLSAERKAYSGIWWPMWVGLVEKAAGSVPVQAVLQDRM